MCAAAGLAAISFLDDLFYLTAAMRLLAHANDEVRKQALLCTQKLLVAKWRFLDGPGGGEVTA